MSIENFVHKNNETSNLDRFMQAAIPIFDASTSSLTQFSSLFSKVSVNGLRVELLDDSDPEAKYMCVFHPTLSSMFLSYLDTDKKDSIIEFHEELPPYLRRPLSTELRQRLNIIGETENSVSSDDSSFEEDTIESGQSVDSKLSEFSWFSVLWTCHR